MTENNDRIERTLELLVFAPLGAGLYVADMAPTLVNMFVARGRAEVDRRQEQVQQRVTTARSLGQVAIAFGVPMVRQKVTGTLEDARRRAQETIGTARPATDGAHVETASAPITEPVARPEAAPTPTGPVAPVMTAVAPVEAVDAVDAPDPSELPIPGYDALSASQVVERLTGLDPSELDVVSAYERAHRQRRTILGKIEQLAG